MNRMRFIGGPAPAGSGRPTAVGFVGRLAAPVFNRQNRAFLGVLLVWGLGAVAIVGVPGPSSVRLIHWANGHMMEDRLLPAFAARFNGAGYRTSAGSVVEAVPMLANSGQITGRLRTLALYGEPDGSEPDPAVVTPAADHWMAQLTYGVGRQVWREELTRPIATTYVGIVTTREMAQCLGWPEREVGFEDVIRLGVQPAGWRAYACAKPSWGDDALLAFTYPDRSSTARSLLYAFYGIAAGRPVEELTLSDVQRPEVAGLIRAFQRRLNCYLPDTLDINLKMLPVPTCAHFFFIAEDNLVKLYQGKVAGKTLERDLVMIYPREGAVVHNHSSFVLDADWVSAGQREAAVMWVDFLRTEPQQSAFMQDGFRRVTEGPCIDPLGSPFSPCTVTPKRLIYPDGIDPAVAEEILRAWR
jgi:Ca-activated chloride channel family protein